MKAVAVANAVRAITFASRPTPPTTVAELAAPRFEIAKSLASWVHHIFIRQGGTLHNPDHAHLEFADIAFLWTNVPYRYHERWLVGTAEIPNVMGGAWKKGRAIQQLQDWFGSEPDFLITLYAPLMAKLADRDFCAVLEHELYHCAQATTDLGAPRFHRDGSPIYGIRGHDVEEFVGVVKRYGARGDARALVAAAKRAPVATNEMLELACGTCAGKV